MLCLILPDITQNKMCCQVVIQWLIHICWKKSKGMGWFDSYKKKTLDESLLQPSVVMLFILTQCDVNASDLVCAVYFAQSCHNIEKATGALWWQNNPTWLILHIHFSLKLFEVSVSAIYLWPLVFFFLWTQGSLHGKLEWMSQTPTGVFVLLNRHCTRMHKFGSFFPLHWQQTTQTSLWHIKKMLQIEKYLLSWLSCMLEMCRCMISKVQCWQSF